MPSVPQASPGAPDPLRLDPNFHLRDTGGGLVIALERKYRAVGTPDDVHRELDTFRRRAHEALDANLDGLVRRVEDGCWFPAGRPLCVLPGGQR